MWRLNPLHGQAIRHALAIIHSPVISQVIQEWQSPNWHTPGWTLLAGLWAVIIGAVALRRLTVTPWFWWWGGTVLATLWHQRMVLYNWPLTLLLLGGLFPPMSALTGARQRIWSLGLVSGSAVVILTRILTPGGVAQYATAMHSPTAVVQWCVHHPTSGLTLTPYRLGGYWEAQGVSAVWIDGRTQFWTVHHRLGPYLAWQQGRQPVTFWTAHDVSRIVWPTTATTPQTLWLEQAHWHPVYRGDGLTVWQPSLVP
ncbi:hypothetical protein [Sulfobacillus thermosulfidooxidans]|uniref:hypothetical protein n=1 Tax=Sulfobacillus thermosulfidooxidans TaxID=28034 RepID=UPI000A031219|nr:hypothetical protein [Sulfobacillus thermosulfidooxidans]